MRIERFEVLITTDEEGDGNGWVMDPDDPETTFRFTGYLLAVSYVKEPIDPFADGVDFSIIRGEVTGDLWAEDDVNDSKVVFTHQQACDLSGNPVNGPGGEPLYLPMLLADEPIRVMVSNGGDTRKGSFHFLVDRGFAVHRMGM